MVQLGLVSKKSDSYEQYNEIPLKDVDVSTNIEECFATTKVTHVYTNTEDKSLAEIYYRFSLPTNAIVIDLTVSYSDGTILKGEFSEKTKAKQTYTDAKSDKKRTCLLEKMRDGIYNVYIGNMEKNTSLHVSYSFINFVKSDLVGYKYIFPTNIAPKYVPAKTHDYDPLNGGGFHHSTSPNVTYVSSSPYHFNFVLNWNSRQKIKNMYSTNEKSKCDFEINSEFSRVLKVNQYPENGDISITLESENKNEELLFTNEVNGEKYIGLVKKIPDVEEDVQVNREFIFLLDRSGSMEGEKIKQAIDALIIFISSLPIGSKFNVLSFGSNYQLLFEKSVDYTNDTKNEAIKQVSSYGANLGGTEIEEPLVVIASKSLPDSINERVLILLTDGQVANTNNVIKFCGNMENTRIFTVGVGRDADRNLVENVANITNATSVFVNDFSKMSDYIVELLDSVNKQYITRPRLLLTDTTDELIVTQTYSEITGAVYPGRYYYCISSFPSEKTIKNAEFSYNELNKHKKVELNIESITKFSDLNKFFAFAFVETEKKIDPSDKDGKLANISVKNGIVNDYVSLVLVDQTKKIEDATKEIVIPHVQHAGYLDDMTEGCAPTSFKYFYSANSVARSANASYNGARRQAGGSVTRSANASSKGAIRRTGLIDQRISSTLLSDDSIESIKECSTTLSNSSTQFSKKSSGTSGFAQMVSKGISAIFNPFNSKSSTNVPASAAASLATGAARSTHSQISDDEDVGGAGGLFGDDSDEDRPTNSVKSKKSVQHTPATIFDFQQIDGSFILSEVLLTVIGATKKDLEDKQKYNSMTEERAYYELILKFLKSDTKYKIMLKKTEQYMVTKFGKDYNTVFVSKSS